MLNWFSHGRSKYQTTAKSGLTSRAKPFNCNVKQGIPARWERHNWLPNCTKPRHVFTERSRTAGYDA
jgi:hypothetical protein